MSDELKPCPFCGGEVHLEEFGNLNMSHGEYVYEWTFWHYCPPMGKHRNVHGMGDGAITIESAYFETREDAIAAWNHRANPTTHAVIVSDEATDCATGYCRCELCGEPINQWDYYCRWCGAEVE